MKWTEREQLLDSPDEGIVTKVKGYDRDVISNQFLPKRHLAQVSVEFPEPRMKPDLGLKR